MPDLDLTPEEKAKLKKQFLTQPKDPQVRMVWIVCAMVVLVWFFGGPREWMSAEADLYEEAKRLMVERGGTMEITDSKVRIVIPPR